MARWQQCRVLLIPLLPLKLECQQCRCKDGIEGCLQELVKLNLQSEEAVRYIGNFRYILIPEIINKFTTVMSDPVRAKHVQVFKLKLK
jgi:hypothetical protein